jgi:flagellar basal-body rod protein FlgG
VTLADGSTGYTRAGVLQIDADGKLRDHDGRVLLPEITIPSDTLEIAIDPEGRVNCRTAGSPDTSTSLGQLQLHRFVNPAGLRNEGSAWRPCEASGYPVSGCPGMLGLGLLKQGFRERSNVQLADELMQLQALDRQHLALLEVLRRSGMVVP